MLLVSLIGFVLVVTVASDIAVAVDWATSLVASDVAVVCSTTDVLFVVSDCAASDVTSVATASDCAVSDCAFSLVASD